MYICVYIYVFMSMCMYIHKYVVYRVLLQQASKPVQNEFCPSSSALALQRLWVGISMGGASLATESELQPYLPPLRSLLQTPACLPRQTLPRLVPVIRYHTPLLLEALLWGRVWGAHAIVSGWSSGSAKTIDSGCVLMMKVV